VPTEPEGTRLVDAHVVKRGTIGVVVWFLGIVIVLVVGAAVVVATGRGGGMAPAYDDRADVLVPSGAPVTGDTLRSVRFSVGLRGYRMDEVDALLARLAYQLDEEGADRREQHGDRTDRPDDHQDDR
jgi:DivIVA domain-containing protein